MLHPGSRARRLISNAGSFDFMELDKPGFLTTVLEMPDLLTSKAFGFNFYAFESPGMQIKINNIKLKMANRPVNFFISYSFSETIILLFNFKHMDDGSTVLFCQGFHDIQHASLSIKTGSSHKIPFIINKILFSILRIKEKRTQIHNCIGLWFPALFLTSGNSSQILWIVKNQLCLKILCPETAVIIGKLWYFWTWRMI